MNLYLKSYIFSLHFVIYLHVWIRIPNTDPNPGSSWIRIQYGSTILVGCSEYPAGYDYQVSERAKKLICRRLLRFKKAGYLAGYLLSCLKLPDILSGDALFTLYSDAIKIPFVCRYTVWDPWMIVNQIITLQAVFYVSLGKLKEFHCTAHHASNWTG